MLMNRILVDTNVLVYSIDEDSKFNSRAIKLLTNPNYDLYTTSKNLSEFLVVLTKGIEVPLTIKESVDLLEGLMANLSILYPSKNSYRQFKKLILKYKKINPRVISANIKLSFHATFFNIKLLIVRTINQAG